MEADTHRTKRFQKVHPVITIIYRDSRTPEIHVCVRILISFESGYILKIIISSILIPFVYYVPPFVSEYQRQEEYFSNKLFFDFIFFN